MIVEFDSLTAFAEKASTARGWFNESTWAGEEDSDECMNRLRNGDDKLVPEAEKIMDRLNANIAIPERQVMESPFGAWVIPDVLAGYPMPARRHIIAESEGAPIRVFVGIVYSAGFTREQLIARGTALLALVMSLNARRPVELVLFTEMHGEDDGKTLFKIKVDSQPMSLAHACHALTSIRFTRSLAYGLGREMNGFNGHWCKGHKECGDSLHNPNDGYIAQLRKWLGATEQDLIIPGSHVYDKLTQDPIEYINKVIAVLLNGEEL